MLIESTLENLIQKPESSILDFKAKMYELEDKNNPINLSKFIKDILSFTNTIRNETSYIIVGISEEENGSKKLIGLSQTYDDAFFQDKVKDKVNPRPNFTYYELTFNAKRFGILEFPITKYSTPIHPVVKLKGLNINAVYYRHGTTNTEAIGVVVIRINNWLQSLPEYSNQQITLDEEISSFLKRVSSGEEKLSTILSDLLRASKRHGLTDLKEFCSREIRGIKDSTESDSDEISYRSQLTIISLVEIEINPYSIGATPNRLKNEMQKRDDCFNINALIPYSISQIEEKIVSFEKNPNSLCCILPTTYKKMLPETEGEDRPIYLYFFKSTFDSLYNSIRQKAVDELMRV